MPVHRKLASGFFQISVLINIPEVPPSWKKAWEACVHDLPRISNQDLSMRYTKFGRDHALHTSKYFITVISRVHERQFVSARRSTPARRNRQMGGAEQFNRDGGKGNGSANVTDRHVRSRTKPTPGTRAGVDKLCIPTGLGSVIVWSCDENLALVVEWKVVTILAVHSKSALVLFLVVLLFSLIVNYPLLVIVSVISPAMFDKLSNFFDGRIAN